MTLNPIVFALRHPVTVMVAILALVLGSVLAVTRMKMDIFPSLNLPVIYVAQPYGGLDTSTASITSNPRMSRALP
jgi:multidrug efflux pump subunit AcrB